MGRQNRKKLYRLSLIDDASHEKIYSIKFTKGGFFTVLAVSVCSLLGGLYALLVFTPLHYTVPGYPDADFTLMGMCSVMFDGVTWEMEGQWQDERFMVTAVSEKEDFSDLTVREGLFSLTRRQEMTALLLRWMEDAGAVQPRAYVNITGMYDERCDGSKSLEEMLQGGVRMAMSAQIFISGEQNAHVDAQWLDQALKCRGVDILANVWVLPEMPEGEPTRDWAREMRTRDDTAHFDLYVDGEPEC